MNDAQTLANVLIVDDRKTDVLLLQLALQTVADVHCDLHVERDSLNAFELIKNRASKEERIDIILLDINMPGMDGFEFLEKMRADEEMKHIDVIMCTGSTYDKDMEKAAALGVIGYAVKPVSFETLKPMLERSSTTRLQAHPNNSYSLLRA